MRVCPFQDLAYGPAKGAGELTFCFWICTIQLWINVRKETQKMMRFGWFQDPDNVVYADVEEFADHFGKETGIENFRTKLDAFRAQPTKEGILLKGKKRTTVKLFIPDLYFSDKKTKLEMGDTVWVYMGEYYPCYCVYWPQGE